MLLKKAMEECKIAACLYQLEGRMKRRRMQKRSMVRISMSNYRAGDIIRMTREFVGMSGKN